MCFDDDVYIDTIGVHAYMENNKSLCLDDFGRLYRREHEQIRSFQIHVECCWWREMLQMEAQNQRRSGSLKHLWYLILLLRYCCSIM